ncbi:MAG: hypothetical protein GC146_09475 [Limimaricola sp.]|uniref:YrhK family protein n=1 Tax=Limimaricola sp. TaxID=2211665 RepID=UPI001DFF3E8A|nr:YrhK family protein [Limimaricola sp.]MBI1417440.1 hypothetical protein [Limimaricola sp.]
MRLFDSSNSTRNPRTRRTWALFELAHTLVDFGAALCFIIGSAMFFYASLQVAATWFFLVGSFLFAAKPTLRFWREIKLLRIGDYADLADRTRN